MRARPTYLLLASALVAAMVGRMGWLDAFLPRMLIVTGVVLALAALLIGLALAVVVYPFLVVRWLWRLLADSIQAPA